MGSKNNPLSRKENLVTQQIGKEVLIYDLSISKAFCLNETSSVIWQLCDGNSSVSEISHKLSEKFNITASEDLVWLAIDELKKENLLQNAQELENKFDGISRREVIKKVGLGTLIALPLISAVIAPEAVNAGSVAAITCPASNPVSCAIAGSGNRTNGCYCTNTVQCVTGLTCRTSTANPALSCCRA